MASINNIANEFIREEIEEFLEAPDEIERTIDIFAQTTPAMQDIAAALIDGDHHTVDELTEAALETAQKHWRLWMMGSSQEWASSASSSEKTLFLCQKSSHVPRAMKAGMAHIEPILSDSGIEPVGHSDYGNRQRRSARHR